MAAIGILGGMGPQASAHLHHLLVRDTPKHMTIESDSDFPEIVLLSVPVPNFITNKNRVPETKHILIERTRLLEQAGCIVNGIACNTAHILLPDLQATTKIPFLPIPGLVAKRVKRMRARRVGLLATPTTLQSRLYDDALGSSVRLIRPGKVVSNQIEALILKQLKSMLTEPDRAQLRSIVDAFLDKRQLDAVILGCTELPLIFGETEDERVIDTLQVLCDGLLSAFATARRAVGNPMEIAPMCSTIETWLENGASKTNRS